MKCKTSSCCQFDRQPLIQDTGLKSTGTIATGINCQSQKTEDYMERALKRVTHCKDSRRGKKSLTKTFKNICLNCILTVHQVHTYTFKKQEKVIMFQPRTPQNQKHQRHKTYIRYKYVWENMLLQRIIRICWRRRQNFDIQQLFMKLMFFHILEYPTRAMMSLALQWEKHVSTVHGLSPSVSNSY